MLVAGGESVVSETPRTDALAIHGSKYYNHPRYDDKLLKLCRTLEIELSEARDKALEEAAQICQQSGTGTQIELVCKAFADSIRDLKSKRDGEVKP